MGVQSLARALAVNRSLQELNISKNEIGDNGIAHIATALQINNTLKTLKMSVTNFNQIDINSIECSGYYKHSLELKLSSTCSDNTTEKIGECISTDKELCHQIQEWFQIAGVKKLIQSRNNIFLY